ncbi:hypothetical protein BH10BAC3_BH10BAC3_14990 [soil metagenome]
MINILYPDTKKQLRAYYKSKCVNEGLPKWGNRIMPTAAN